MKKTCYITTPIYYSSGIVHIGNSYTTIVCDAFARFKRFKGVDTFYLTGMDEHGQKIEEAALKNNKSPQEFVDGIAQYTKELWKKLNITNDDFIQTSELRHTEVVQEMFEKLIEKGDIYLGKYEGDYCVSCESFFTKTQIVKEGCCPDCDKPLRKVQEEGYFLKLKKYEKQLLDFIKENPDFIQPESRKNEVVSFIEQGLEDLCVSRTSFKWGIPVKSNPKHVVYVWVDALSNYITALGYNTKNDELFKKFWLNGDEVYHVVGKDILRFHAVYWPIILMALEIPVRFKLLAHGWVLMRAGKMSKSKGNVIYPLDIVERYGLDALRFFLIKEMPLGNDAIFSYDRFIEVFNNSLVNDLGNLLSRTTAMINKYFDGKLTKPLKKYFDFDKSVEEVVNNTIKVYQDTFDKFHFQAGLNEIWAMISRANKYIDETLPWVLAKDENKKQELNSVLYTLYEVLRLVGLMIYPVTPDTAIKIFEQLNIPEKNRVFENLKYWISENASVSKESLMLFKRLDVEAELKFQEEKNNESLKEELNLPEISIEDFNKIDLRVGKVVECNLVKDSSNLLLFKISLDEKIYQIVSGIAKYYNPNELVNKNIVFVKNLKPCKIKGILSEGMILTATDGKVFEILELKKVENGKVS
ncbi:MAG: methionine--tRNA ligase [Bacilli bacterium]|nr:methionine--tRNA ligase [Bacilli bacterium]